MIKALLMILMPARTWERIANTARSFWFVLFLYLGPTLVLSIAGELAGRDYFAKRNASDELQPMAEKLAIRYGSVEFVSGLMVVFLCAWLVKMLSKTFHHRNTYEECFRVVAYASGPFLLFRLLDVIPGMLPWVTFAIGMLVSVSTMYSGIPRVLKPDPPHAFGLYLMSSIMLIMVSGWGRFLTLLVLQGKITLP
jgi:hypothetical protein